MTKVSGAGVVMSAWANFTYKAECDSCGRWIALTTSRAEAQAAAKSHRC